MPAGLDNVVAITAGPYHNLAMRSDGTVFGWGLGTYGRTALPPRFACAAALAAGGEHSLAIAWQAPELRIDNGAAFTANRSVVLHTTSGPFATYWRLSESPTFAGVPWGEVGASLRRFRLSEGDGLKTLYFSVKRVGGDITTVSASITLIPEQNRFVSVWGTNANGLTSVPLDLTNAVALAGGYYHVLALRSDGRISAWGLNSLNQCVVPPGLSNVVDVAAGYAHGVALKDDTTVAVWGTNAVGGSVSPPAGLSNVVMVAAGDGHVLALKADGSLVGWGHNDRGQCDPPAGLTNVVAIAARESRSFALNADGTTVEWGEYGLSRRFTGARAIAIGAAHQLVVLTNGTIGISGNDAHGQTNVPSGTTNVVAVTAGWDHSLALKADGTIAAWGESAAGQCTIPAAVSAGAAAAVAAGRYYSAAIVHLLPPTVTFFRIENGAPSTANPTVRLASLCEGRVTDYMVSSRSDFLGATWQPYTPLMLFDLSAGAGTKAVFFRARNEGGASAPVSSSIALRDTSTALPVAAWGSNSGGQSGTPPNGRLGVIALAGGEAHSLLLGANGTVSAYGTNALGQCNVPAALSNSVIAIAAGANHGLALTRAGTVSAWGANAFGQTNVPAGLSNVVAIAAGNHHSLALTRDGTVVAWGAGDDGQTNLPVFGADRLVVDLAAGGDHCLAIGVTRNFRKGAVSAWGRGDYGQCSVPPSLTDARAVAAGYDHSLALKTDGTVVAWGRGQLGQTNVPAGLSSVAGIAAGELHNLARKTDGTVVAWGHAEDGQCAVPNRFGTAAAIAGGGRHSLAIGQIVPTLHSVWLNNGTTATLNGTIVLGTLSSGTPTQIRISESSSFADATWQLYSPLARFTLSGGAGMKTVYVQIRTASGESVVQSVQIERLPVDQSYVVAWGLNTSAQCTPLPAGLSNAVAVAAGEEHSLAVRPDGTVAAWGITNFHECSVPAGLSNVWAVAAGNAYSLALKTDGRLTAWGDGDVSTTMPAGLSNVVAVSGNRNNAIALRANGTLVAWGDNLYGQTNVPAGLANVIAVAASMHSLVLKADGTVVAWGHGTSGQTNIPPGLSNVIAVAVGNAHSLALKSDGHVVAWGANTSYQCELPADLTNAVAIAARGHYSLAVRADGTVTVWGYTPQPPQGLTGVLAAAIGGEHVVALGTRAPALTRLRLDNGAAVTLNGTVVLGVSLQGYATEMLISESPAFAGAAWVPYQPLRRIVLSDGAGTKTVYVKARNAAAESATLQASIARVLPGDRVVLAWGLNANGQCNVPAGLSNVVALAAGSRRHSVALKADGTVAAWGYNLSGQCTVPPDLTDALAVAAGSVHSAALKADGTVRAWGDNADGQSTVPGDLTDAVAIACGGLHTLALRGNGTVAAWGNTNSGQCAIPSQLTNPVAIAAGDTFSVGLQGDGIVRAWGTGFYGQCSVPAGLSNVVAITAGAEHVLALRADGTVAAWGRSDYGQTNVPPGLAGVVAVAAGVYHSAALKADGTVVAWGGDANEQSSVIPGCHDALALAAGGSHNLVLGRTIPRIHRFRIENGLPQTLNPSVVIGSVCSTVPDEYQLSETSAFSGAQWQPYTPLARVKLSSGNGAKTLHFRVRSAGGISSAASAMIVRKPSVGTTVIGWGQGGQGQTTIPGDLGDVVALCGSSFNSVALQADGTVSAWGWISGGLNDLPEGLTNVVMISAIRTHGLALQANGKVAAWGFNTYGETVVPEALSNVTAVAIAAGYDHSLALTDRGLIVAWGRTNENQCAVPSGLSNVVAVVAGNRFSLALQADGAIVAWGDLSSGQGGIPAGLDDAIAVGASPYDGVALRSNGTVRIWGNDEYGENLVPAGLDNAVAVAGGYAYALALGSDGRVTAWGRGEEGQTNVPAAVSNAVAIAAGYAHGLAILSGIDATGIRLPAGVPGGDQAQYEAWVAAHPSWGTDFSGIPVTDFAAAHLVDERPVSGLATSVTFSIVYFAADSRERQARLQLAIGGSPKRGPVNGRLVFDDRATLTLGDWGACAVQDAGNSLVFTEGVVDVFWESLEEDPFLRAALTKSAPAGVLAIIY